MFPPSDLPSIVLSAPGANQAEPRMDGRNIGAPVDGLTRQPFTPVQPRALAQDADFGYPAYGTAGARGFLDRLEDETRREPAAAHRTRQSRAVSATALAYWKEPRARLLQTYTGLLRSGLPAAASQYRKAVTDSFQTQSPGEARQMDDWLELVVTFLRRMAELQASVRRLASENVKPFAIAEVERQTERGLAMLRALPFVAPVTETTASVLASAGAERERRIAGIDTFYEQALTSGSVVGLPATTRLLAFWLRDGRLIFKNLDMALAMSPRPEFVRHSNYWPTSIRRFNEFRYGPAHFHGALPTTIEYVDPDHQPRFGVSSEAAFTVIETDFSLDRDHARDRWRVGKGPWQTFAQITTLELELRKATGYARLHHAAEEFVGRN